MGGRDATERPTYWRRDKAATHVIERGSNCPGYNKRGWSYPLSLTTSASIHEKAGTKAPARNQLQTNPEAGTQTRDGRERLNCHRDRNPEPTTGSPHRTKTGTAGKLRLRQQASHRNRKTGSRSTGERTRRRAPFLPQLPS